ncbi:MAG: type III-B CRISPR module-associated Cmr3 family protein [Candidatus Nanopelagicales bacterium]
MTRQRTTRTSLTDAETALESHLFSRDALARHQVFSAVAWGDLSWLTSISTIWVGGRRTVGGRATVTALPEKATAPAVSGNTFDVRLESPGIFLDKFGGNSLRPTDADLATVFGSVTTRVANNWVRSEVVGGWNAAAGLPKSSDLAAVAGSVYRLQFPRPVTQADVLAVEQAGLGVRRADGYGWVSARPWAPPSVAQTAEVRRPDPDTAAVTLATEAARFDQQFVRQVLGWVRAGIEPQDLTGAAAYNGLVPEGRHLVDTALAYTAEQRRQLIIALEVRS